MGDYRIGPAGEHKARGLSGALCIDKDGNQYVEIIFQLLTGQQIDWWGWFGDDLNKNSYTIQALRTCGWSGNDLTNLAGIDRNVVTLVIEDIERKGHQRSRVKYVNRCGDLPVHRNAMSALEAEDLARRMAPICAQVTAYGARKEAGATSAPTKPKEQHRTVYAQRKVTAAPAAPLSHVIDDPFAGDDFNF